MIVEPVVHGVATLRPDPDRPGAWTLLVDDVPQSHVDLRDPRHLEFEYVRRLASVIDAAAPAAAPLRVLHLGGGAYTLPRYVQATRPGSGQLVVERDAALVELIGRVLPTDTDIRVLVDDARAAVQSLPDDSFDLVIADVYQADRMPSSLASVEFAAQVARVLRPSGRYAANITDLPALAFARVQAATLRTVFADVCVIAEPGLLHGRRRGNVVLVAAREPGGLPLPALADAARRDPFPARVVHGAELAAFTSGSRAATDETAQGSPAVPRDYFGRPA